MGYAMIITYHAVAGVIGQQPEIKERFLLRSDAVRYLCGTGHPDEVVAVRQALECGKRYARNATEYVEVVMLLD